MGSLEILLERAERDYSDVPKRAMASRKNSFYRELLKRITPDDILPGALEFMDELKQRGVKVAVASSSRNCPTILDAVGLPAYFDAVVDGNDITNTKPDPEIFLLAADRLGVPPERCAVVEDALAGTEAARAAGMKSVGVGYAARDEDADLTAEDLSLLSVYDVLEL